MNICLFLICALVTQAPAEEPAGIFQLTVRGEQVYAYVIELPNGKIKYKIDEPWMSNQYQAFQPADAASVKYTGDGKEAATSRQERLVAEGRRKGFAEISGFPADKPDGVWVPALDKELSDRAIAMEQERIARLAQREAGAQDAIPGALVVSEPDGGNAPSPMRRWLMPGIIVLVGIGISALIAKMLVLQS